MAVVSGAERMAMTRSTAGRRPQGNQKVPQSKRGPDTKPKGGGKGDVAKGKKRAASLDE